VAAADEAEEAAAKEAEAKKAKKMAQFSGATAPAKHGARLQLGPRRKRPRSPRPKVR
jgi:hypothetical protein